MTDTDDRHKNESRSVCWRVAELTAGSGNTEIEPYLVEHVAWCVECRMQIEMHRRLERLRGAPVPQLSPGFARRVTRLATMQERAAPSRSTALLFEAAYALACIAWLSLLLSNAGFRAPSLRLSREALLWLVPAGFAVAMSLPGLLRAAQRRIVRLLTS